MNVRARDTLGKRIYCDFAASTPVAPEVLSAMEPYWSDVYGNASAIHQEGRTAKQAIEDARARCARAVDAHPDEIIFTSGGTESNNFAIFGIVEAYLQKHHKTLDDIHIVTLSVEHSSLLDCVAILERRGASATYLSVDHDGQVSLDELRRAMRPETALVSAMLVNSEIGVVYPIHEIAKIVAQARRKEGNAVYLHTDASQGSVYLDCNVRMLGVDAMTMDAQKIYGPKGVGFLFVRRGTPIAPIIFGGGQERGLRPGTPNTPLIVGMARALELANERRDVEVERVRTLRDYFITRVESEVPCARLNGSRTIRTANNASFAFLGNDAELLLVRLDMHGIACSTKSPCKGVSGGSHVIAALGKGEEYVKSTLRFSFGQTTTKEDVDAVVDALKAVVAV